MITYNLLGYNYIIYQYTIQRQICYYDEIDYTILFSFPYFMYKKIFFLNLCAKFQVLSFMRCISITMIRAYFGDIEMTIVRQQLSINAK